MRKARLSMSECLRVADKAATDEYRAKLKVSGNTVQSQDTEAQAERDQLREQNKELVEALDRLRQVCEAKRNRMGLSIHFEMALRHARAVLAKVRP